VELNIRGEMEAAAAEMESVSTDTESSSQDASPASESVPASESSEEAPAQDAGPATEDAPASSDSSSPPEEFELPVGGSIPVPRVRKILENARAKGRAEVEQQLQTLAWAKEVDRAQAEEAMRVYQFANQNPVEFYRAVTERLRSDPTLRTEVERIWQPAQQPAAAPQQSDRPEPDVLLEDGRLVYSATQMEKLLDWKERLIEGQISQRLEPIEKERKLTAQMHRIEAESKRVYEDVVKWPGMADAENRKAVAELMISQRIPVDVAYRQVVLPKLTDTKSIEERVRKQVLAELKLKGRASTENPQRVASSSENYKGKSIREILEATADELGME